MAARAPKTAVASNVHAVVGNDDGAVKEAARARAEKLAPVSLDDLSTEVIDGAVDHADTAAERIYATISALQTLPFFGGAKLVWLKSASFLADDVLGRSNAVIEALETLATMLLAGVPADVQFLLSAIDVDKRRSFYKTLGKVGQVEVHDGVDSSRSGWEEKAAPLVAQRAAARKLRFDSDAERLFIFLTGGDARQIDNELEKIDLYLGPERREVLPDDVRMLVSHSREGVIFERGDAIQRRDLEDALGLLAQLMQQKESAIGILLVAIAPTMRNLLLVKDLQENHRLGRVANPFQFGDALSRLPAEATGHLPRKKDGGINTYGLGFAAQATDRFSLAELRAGLQACLDANLALVTTGTEPQIVLEQLLVRLLSCAPAFPRRPLSTTPAF
jgi:DNA polymerase-3 subunit delta